MDKFVFIKTAEYVPTQSGGKYLKVIDQEGQRFNVFDNILNKVKLEVGKSYLFKFSVNSHGFNDIELVTPLVNIFQQKALKDTANKQELFRNLSVALSYSKDLVSAGRIDLEDMFTKADEIYEYLQGRADKEMAKLEGGNAQG